MAEKKIFLSDDYSGTIYCDSCQRSFTVDLSRFVRMPKQPRIKSKCPCGNSWTTVVEKRRHFRKTVNLAGEYKYRPQGRPAGKGNVTVADISKSGIRLMFGKSPDFRIGDWMDLAFHLDDRNRSYVTKTVVVENICHPYVGVSFSPHESEDRTLGFYLFS
jgi:hypothetical protein